MPIQRYTDRQLQAIGDDRLEAALRGRKFEDADIPASEQYTGKRGVRQPRQSGCTSAAALCAEVA